MSYVGALLAIWLGAQWLFQAHDAIVLAKAPLPQRSIVDYIKEQYRTDPALRVFCDDITVRVLSNLPRSVFVRSEELPEERDSFLAELKNRQPRFLVYINSKWSTPTALFPALASGRSDRPFELVLHEHSEPQHSEIWLYALTW